MADTIELIFGIAIPAVLILLGLTVGTITERRHFTDLARRERALAHLLVTDLRTFPPAAGASPTPAMIVREAVIGTDYFKTFVAMLKKFIGGELRSYETLMERARREALLRVLEDAHRQGFDAVCNVRIDTADIQSPEARSKAKATAVGVIVSGTAYRRG